VPEQIDFDPVDAIGVGTIGPPGQRQFFLRASRAGRSVVLYCEKVHVQGLVSRIQQLMTAQGKELPEQPASATAATPPEAEDPEWTIGELGLGFHEAKERFVIVAREAATGEEEADVEELATARFWVDESQVRAFVAQATTVLASGRATCPRCGLPMDPSGHPCPAANGSRPIF
jgi:uncharacterized repeat protein (TIGR03847 family)